MAKKVLIVLAVVLIGFVACREKSSSSESGPIKVGVSFYALSGEFNTGLRNAMEKYLQDNNIGSDQVSINILDAQGDANKQNSQVETLISDKYDVIVMCSGDAEAQAQVTIASVNAGIPMIELCTSTNAVDQRTAYVGSSDITSGRMLMQQLGEMSGGKGKMVALHGPTGISAAVYREKGMYEIIEENGWDYQIVAEKVCNWSREQAMSTIENYLNSGLDFDIIFAENDEMAVGALAAIENSGTKRKIYLGGIDAIPDAVQAVLEGRMDCTVFQDASGQGRTAMEVAIKAAKGEPIEKMYDIPFQMVLQDNARKFLP
ncbi:MAG: substrate-binding domain-containing protein [Treponema sp.]|jgi:inositol transport system substrate-binding protein|nr:substrate-binding domain-containing protein [Treponema sp.]